MSAAAISFDDVVLATKASNRHDNLAEIVLGAKGLFLDRESFACDVSLASSVKLPMARPRDLTNAGTTDINFTLLATLPLGEQNLLVDTAGVELVPFYHGGLGVSWRLLDHLALTAQLEGNTSAFRDVAFLEDGPLTAFFGLRWMAGAFFLEGGGGTGLIAGSSYDYGAQFALGYVFGGSTRQEKSATIPAVAGRDAYQP